MSRDLSEVIDDYSLDTYGHTNWAYVSTLDDEQKSWAGTIEGEVKYYHEDKCLGCDMIISKCEDSDYCKQINKVEEEEEILAQNHLRKWGDG